MSYQRAFYALLLNQPPAATLPGSHTRNLAFVATNKLGGDNTLFVGNVELLDTAGAVVDGGLVNAKFTFPATSYLYLAGGTDPRLGWVFDGGAGIAAQGSAFGPPYSADPAIQQTCFLQGGASSIKQDFALPAGRYRVRFRSAQRDDNQANTLTVYVNSQLVKAEFTPTRPGGFQAYTTDFFTL